MKKSWQQKMAEKENTPKILKLEKNYPCYNAVHKMGAEPGDDIVLVNPREVASLMNLVPKGKLTTLTDICKQLAVQYSVKATCTLTAGIFTMTAANAAEEMKAEGKRNDLAYWRTLKAGGELNPKYPGGIAGQAAHLEREGHIISYRGKRAFVKDYESYNFTDLMRNEAMPGEIKITRLSTASWFKIKSRDKIIYFDPGFAGYMENQGIPMEELADKADIILISHCHKDHLQPAAVERIIKDETVIIAPVQCAASLDRVHTVVEPGDSVDVDGVKVIAVDAYNTEEGHSTRKVHHKGECAGYLVDVFGRCLYFAGDSDFISEMERLGNVDIAFLPIGGTFVMDIEEAVAAVCVINPRIVFSMHESKEDPEVFKKEVSLKSDAKVIILEVGESAFE